MLTDAHCHPFDLVRVFPQSEDERAKLGVLAAASACTLEEFLFHEALPDVLPCFGIHPQFFSQNNTQQIIEENLGILNELASEKRIAAIGECGFDLFDKFKETEAVQEEMFAAHLEIALKYELPLVLHVRRAMFKLSAYINKLAKCKAVIFHTWPGTYEEALYFLRHGVNAYFSFGNIIMLNHKQAIKSCALLPAERLLTETDTPYAPRRGENFSQWSDLPLILEAAAAIRSEVGNSINAKDLETQIELNFKKIFYK